MIETELQCPKCDYDLRGLPENRCPECGEPFSIPELERRLIASKTAFNSIGLVLLFIWPGSAFAILSLLSGLCGLAPLAFVWGMFLLFVVPVNAAYTLVRFDTVLRVKRRLDPDTKFGVVRSLVFYLSIAAVQLAVAFFLAIATILLFDWLPPLGPEN